MNKWVPIIKDIQNSIVRIVLFSKGKIISEGTGTLITSNGLVLTASHILDEYPTYKKIDKECFIYVFTTSGRFEYDLVTNSFVIGIPDLTDVPMEIIVDLAVLSPINTISFIKYLPPVLECINVEMGEDMLMCGYSEETPSMIELSHILKDRFFNLTDTMKNEVTLIEGSLKPPTFKSGILSHTTHIYVESPPIHYQFLHIDNGVHGGMSGGPIINSKGEFIGVITQRTIVKANVMSEKKIMSFEVPSGNSIGITLNYLVHVEGFLDHYNQLSTR